MRRAHSRAAMSASLVEATVKRPTDQQAQATGYCSVVFDVSRGSTMARKSRMFSMCSSSDRFGSDSY